MTTGVCLLLGLLLPVAEAFRIPLDFDAEGPFLQSSVAGAQGGPYTSKIVLAPFSWSNVYLGKLLHMSDAVEIGPRGVLFIQHSSSRAAPNATPCMPSPLGLCRLPEGLVLPSSFFWDPSRDGAAMFPVTSEPALLSDPLLRLFASIEATSCGMERKGTGRFYYTQAEYTVTACDVVQGSHILVYRPQTHEVVVLEQTFGPFAYLTVLISATVHICALGRCSSPPSNAALNFHFLDWVFQWNGLLSIVVSVVLYFRALLRFHLLEDEVFFMATAALGLVYLALRQDMPEGYIFALSTLATTLYRTHETPYAPIIAYILGYKTIQKVVCLCHGRCTQMAPNYADLFLSILHTSIFCEIALEPQCIYREVWPVYYMFHALVCYHIVKYQELCFFKGSATSN